MPVSSLNPFPLGAYLGNPDNSSPSNQALFESNLTSFEATLGVGVRYLDSFVDQRQPISSWAGNSMWAASSVASSSLGHSVTPVIAVPFSSTASGALTSDASFQAFASGQYDSVLQGIVKAWTSQGFTNLVFRPGWEMNLMGSTYAGSDAKSQADWVAAFQHVSTVLHQAGAANGASVQVVWNPGTTNYSNASATGALYPGDSFVDVIGADVYSDIYPYSDGGATPTYHDWDTGQEDTTTAQFITDPVNRTHYWSQPAATKWSSDSSQGHSQSLDSLIQFAELHHKPFAIPETGAGNTNGGVDVSDDAAFPQWLSQELNTARAAGETISFVNLWDSNGGGTYAFSHAADGKPAENAAWGQYFGAYAPVVTVGSGSADIVLGISEDAYAGNAQFTVSVDGTQIGGTLTATVSHAAGQSQAFDIKGSFAPGPHSVSVRFLNDAYAGPGKDRNLYVDSVSYGGGVTQTGAALNSTGARVFSVTGYGQPQDTLTLKMSEQAYRGDAQFKVTVDGVAVGGVQTVTAQHGSASQVFTFTGSFGPAAHTIGISFLNDLYGGSAALDRNLYVDGVALNGVSATPASVALLSTSTKAFVIPAKQTVAPSVAKAATKDSTLVRLDAHSDALGITKPTAFAAPAATNTARSASDYTVQKDFAAAGSGGVSAMPQATPLYSAQPKPFSASIQLAAHANDASVSVSGLFGHLGM